MGSVLHLHMPCTILFPCAIASSIFVPHGVFAIALLSLACANCLPPPSQATLWYKVAIAGIDFVSVELLFLAE